MKTIKVKARWVGLNLVQQTLKKMEDNLAEEVLVDAVQAAVKPMFEAAKSEAPIRTTNLTDPRKHPPGTLKKGIYHRLADHSRYRAIAHIGAGGLGRYYWHLVEFGHKTKGGGFVDANAFMTRAFENTIQLSMHLARQVLWQKVKLIIAKYRRG